jgi:uncharacterized membrane protein
MVLMLLDHMRDFTHEGGFPSDPLDLATTTPLLCFTRWISHVCAPSFVFLAGLGAGLQRLRGKPVPELSHFLWTRGLWLVFLELTLIRGLVKTRATYACWITATLVLYFPRRWFAGVKAKRRDWWMSYL